MAIRAPDEANKLNNATSNWFLFFPFCWLPSLGKELVCPAGPGKHAVMVSQKILSRLLLLGHGRWWWLGVFGWGVRQKTLKFLVAVLICTIQFEYHLKYLYWGIFYSTWTNISVEKFQMLIWWCKSTWLREGSCYQMGWILGKFPMRGGDHFQSKNLCCIL